MNTVLLVCAVVVTVAIVIAIIFLSLALLQVKRTAREAQLLLRSINQELSTIGRITGNISVLVDHLVSPWTKMGGWVSGIIGTVLARRKSRSTVEKEKVDVAG